MGDFLGLPLPRGLFSATLGDGEGTTTATPSAEATVLRKPLGRAGVVSTLGLVGIMEG